MSSMISACDKFLINDKMDVAYGLQILHLLDAKQSSRKCKDIILQQKQRYSIQY